MEKIDQFKLLTKNSLRIFRKTKLLIVELMVLLFIGLTIILTLFWSNNLLEQSKSEILNNSNLADFTVSIPKDIRENSIKEDPNFVGNQYDSNADLALQNELDKLGLEYATTLTSTVSDINSNKSFILYKTENPSSINDLIVNKLVSDVQIPNPIYDSTYREILERSCSIFKLFLLDTSVWISQYGYWNSNYFTYDKYIELEPWLFARLLLESKWNLSNDIVNKIIPILEKLAEKPSTKDEYDKYYNIYLNSSTLNNDSYWYKLRKLMFIRDYTFNGHGFVISAFQTIPLIGETANIPFSIEINDISSYMAIVSSSFLGANRNKQAIPLQTLLDICQLPYNSYLSDSFNPTQKPSVYNPDTGISEPQNSFLSWLANLDDKYKIEINGLSVVLIDSGCTPDMLYPVISSSNLLFNKKDNGVLYLNQAGYSRLSQASNNDETIYYSVRYPPDIDLLKKKSLFSELKQYTINTYGYNTVYNLDDPNQPNNLIYIRSNFLNSLQSIVLYVVICLGLIVGLLSLFFISTLLRSIVKQNKITFGIGIANGISKTSLALSFFPFALIPGVVCGTLSYLLSIFLVNPFISVFSDYWTLTIPPLQIYWWVFLLIALIASLILFLLIIAVISWTLRKKTQDILNSSIEFRMNWFIIHTKWLTSKLGATNSFRVTYIMGNMVRFLVLTFIVLIFSTLNSFILGTHNQFQNALSYNDRNAKYTFAFDLYSPTINAGYYSSMPYNQIGISQDGIYNGYSNGSDYYTGNYDSPLTASKGYYTGIEYANSLEDPYIDDKYFTSLFLPSAKVAGELNNNIQFFNNKVFTKSCLDVDLDITGAVVNPWLIASSMMPTSILNLANDYFESQIEVNYQFYYWLQQQNQLSISGLNPPVIPDVTNQFNGQKIYYSTYLPNVNQQPFTLDGSDLTNDYLNAPNQNQWIFVKSLDNQSNQYRWKINQVNGVNSAPNYTAKPKVVSLIVQMMTNNQNPLFQYWYKYIYADNPNLGDENQLIPNLNYKAAYGIIPVDYSDETYTYINGTITNLNSSTISPVSCNITGIKPNSKYITLYSNKNKSLNSLLMHNIIDKNDVYYPLIINSVVNRLYGYNVGDILTINANNTFDRFNRENLGVNPYNTVKFKIVGITNSKYQEQYYTSQEFANKILGYQDFSEANNTEWEDGLHKPSKGYIPFNGVFTNSSHPAIFYNYAGLYSPSNISTSKGVWNTNIGSGPGEVVNDLATTLANNSSDINRLTRMNYVVDYNNNNNVELVPDDQQKPLLNMAELNIDKFNAIGDFVRNLVNLFKTDLPVTSLVQSFNINSLAIGKIFDKTFFNIELAILLSLIPALLIIIVLLATMIISESARLVSLMKVLGITNFKNTFSFMFVYVVVLFLGILLSIPLTYGGLSLTSLFIFNELRIIITPYMQYWIFLLTFGVLGLFFLALFLNTWQKLKKLNVSEMISTR